MVKQRVDLKWHGKQRGDDAKRAINRAMVAWGTTAAMRMKIRAHRITGTLGRSMHAAPGDYEADETRQAEAGDIPIVVGSPPKWTGDKAVIEAGSWVEYAIYEFNLGGAHDFITEPVSEANERLNGMMAQAFREEGLA